MESDVRSYSIPDESKRRGLQRVRRPLRFRCFGASAALFAYCSLTWAASAQTPFVPDEWKFGKRQESATLHYCVDARDPDFPVARKIGEAIAGALLLQPKEHAIGENLSGEGLDGLYRVFLETCDLYLGFKLIADAYPQWLTVTRPYYRASHVLVVADAGWKSLSDMPKSQAIGSTIGTSADLRLAQYLIAVTSNERWSRFPMSSDEAALNAVINGSAGAALVWEPSLWALKNANPAFAGLRVISPKPFAMSATDVGGALLSNETFLRSNIDQAIASLSADGTIQAIFDGSKFPAASLK